VSATRRRGGGSAALLEPVRGRPRPGAACTITVLVYRGVTTVEAELPAQRIADRTRGEIVFVGPAAGTYPGVEPARPVIADRGPGPDHRPDVLVVPGGLGWKLVADDPAISTWLADAADAARGILAISTGSLLLAAAGRLAGRPATGHWLAAQTLAELGADVRAERVAHAEAGRLLTASGSMAALGAADELADLVNWSR